MGGSCDVSCPDPDVNPCSIRIHQNNLYATVFIKIVVNGSLETSDSSLLLSPPGNQGLESEYNFQMSFGLGKRR